MHALPRRLILALPLAFAAGAALAQRVPKFSQERLEAMFADIRAKTKWNVDGPMLWGYYFFDPDRTKLDAAGAELREAGYRVVSVERIPAKGEFRLHVEKLETHTPQTLYQRNIALETLARQYGIRSYDGMDVGPPSPPPPG